jgi:hypothetical protein
VVYVSGLMGSGITFLVRLRIDLVCGCDCVVLVSTAVIVWTTVDVVGNFQIGGVVRFVQSWVDLACVAPSVESQIYSSIFVWNIAI